LEKYVTLSEATGLFRFFAALRMTRGGEEMFKRKKKRAFPQSSFFNTVKERSAQKKKMVKRILLVLVFAFLVYRFFAGPYGFVQIHALWKGKKNLEKESRILQAEIVDLEIEKKRLAEDKFYLEKQARERLKMIKPGEQMYQVIQKEKSKSKEDNNSSQIAPPDSSSQ
jgi:cell division protein FtsB